MHEMSICESVLQVLEEEAKQQSFDKVKMVCLEIGQLSGIEVEALKFCFDVVCQKSIAEDSELRIEQPPGTAWCMQCAKTQKIPNRFNPCPDCGSHQLQVTGGDEMKIKELEVI